MNQDEFEQTVTQELRELEERREHKLLSSEIIKRLKEIQKELTDVIEVLNEKQ